MGGTYNDDEEWGGEAVAVAVAVAAPLNGNDSPLNVCPTGGNLTWLRLGTRIVPIANRIASSPSRSVDLYS